MEGYADLVSTVFLMLFMTGIKFRQKRQNNDGCVCVAKRSADSTNKLVIFQEVQVIIEIKHTCGKCGTSNKAEFDTSTLGLIPSTNQHNPELITHAVCSKCGSLSLDVRVVEM
jgi:hypothetical protein